MCLQSWAGRLARAKLQAVHACNATKIVLILMITLAIHCLQPNAGESGCDASKSHWKVCKTPGTEMSCEKTSDSDACHCTCGECMHISPMYWELILMVSSWCRRKNVEPFSRSTDSDVAPSMFSACFFVLWMWASRIYYQNLVCRRSHSCYFWLYKWWQHNS